jgi:hypothetical protein
VSTRKLIGIALLCGLAILVAGGIQLFRLSDTSERTVEVLAEGDRAVVGGVEVTVGGSERGPAATRVTVTLASASGEVTVPVASFTLLVGGQLERPTNSGDEPAPACGSSVSIGATGTSCAVLFAPRDGTATLSFSRDGQQRIWRLGPAGA